jgi:hypothetical protein
MDTDRAGKAVGLASAASAASASCAVNDKLQGETLLDHASQMASLASPPPTLSLHLVWAHIKTPAVPLCAQHRFLPSFSQPNSHCFCPTTLPSSPPHQYRPLLYQPTAIVVSPCYCSPIIAIQLHSSSRPQRIQFSGRIPYRCYYIPGSATPCRRQPFSVHRSTTSALHSN